MNVTSLSTLTGNDNLTISGSTISSIKKIGCLGEQTVYASYCGKNTSALLNVKSDFKSISLTCELYCKENYNSVTGNGSRDLVLNLPSENHEGTVDLDLYGTIETIFGDSFSISLSDYTQAWYENDILTNGNPSYTSSDSMMSGDRLNIRINYLEEEVSSFHVCFE